jgi:Alpha/beta hydrolase domain
MGVSFDAKFFKVDTENDVWRGEAALRVPDSMSTHRWEIAGASHVPAAMYASNRNDFRAILGGVLERDLAPQAASQCTHPYAANVQTWAVFSAAYAALDRWVAHGIAPSPADLIQVTAAPKPPATATIARDTRGIGLGGIRLPRVAVATALNTGENAPTDSARPGSCTLVGTHVPFDATTMRSLYPSRDAYMRDARRVVDELVRQQFVLADDAAERIRDAESDYSH